jgi:hypothetical protein
MDKMAVALSSTDKKPLSYSRVIREFENFETTYKKPATEVPRLVIGNAYIQWGLKMRHEGVFDKSPALAVKGLERLGFVIKGADPPADSYFGVEKWGVNRVDVVHAWHCICDAYTLVAPWLLVQAKEYMKLSYLICVGQDVTFDKVYKRKDWFE